ncbi:hypothetical protein RKD26_001456 [Streptomyces calvus]
MADRYDPNSGTNLDKFDNAGDPSSDTWATLVTHITGYPVPDRATIFDTLRSDHGGKLFRMDIKERSLGLLVKDSGFLTNKGEDYDIWFFDSGKKRSIMQARIVFEGRVKAGDEVLFADVNADRVEDAQVREGNEFTDYNKDKMSTIPLARYMNGPRTALLELLGGGTQNARFSNLGVGGADVVDLSSFDTTGESFDFAAKFFKDHATVLKDWEDRFGRDDASWKGEAAEVFRSLLKKVRENYDAYVETFNSEVTGGGTGQTVYSRALSMGRKYLEDSARKLLEAWMTWAKSPYYDPHRVLRYVLDDLAQWVDANNVAKTEITSTTTRYGTTVRHSPQAGFSQTHPEYGDLTDIANWAKVGDKAVKIWSQGVDEYLGKPAAQVQSDLNNHFLDLSKDFSENVPKPKSTGTASQEYEEKKLEEEKEEINRQNEENRKYQDELREEQERQREEDKKYQDELREEQRQQREEDKKYQDELREEQERQREEDQKLQDELRNEANQQRDEEKKYQDELRNEANQQREEDKKYQEELREEQRREQEEAKREAEEQTRAMEESLGGINDPNSVSEQTLGNLDDLLNQNNAVTTESLGDLGDVNGQNGDEQQAFTGNGAPVPPTLGGLGGLNGGPGGTNNSANDAVTQSLGNLGGLNNGTGGSGLKTPTGGSTQLDGGKLTTDFPDGSSTAFDPDSGVLTTTHPDGSVTTQNLGDGLKVTNPDGSVTSLGDDGKLTTTFPDGTTQTVDPTTGQATTTGPDGATTTTDLGNLGNLNGSLGAGRGAGHADGRQYGADQRRRSDDGLPGRQQYDVRPGQRAADDDASGRFGHQLRPGHGRGGDEPGRFGDVPGRRREADDDVPGRQLADGRPRDRPGHHHRPGRQGHHRESRQPGRPQRRGRGAGHADGRQHGADQRRRSDDGLPRRRQHDVRPGQRSDDDDAPGRLGHHRRPGRRGGGDQPGRFGDVPGRRREADDDVPGRQLADGRPRDRPGHHHRPGRQGHHREPRQPGQPQRHFRRPREPGRPRRHQLRPVHRDHRRPR